MAKTLRRLQESILGFASSVFGGLLGVWGFGFGLGLGPGV